MNSSLDWVLLHWPHLTVHRFICVLCLCILCFFHTEYVILLYHSRVDLMGLKSNPLDLSSFSALTLLVGLFVCFQCSRFKG